MPALSLLPTKMDTPEARVMLIAIGLQESGLTYRKQINGPARGFWQFEIVAVLDVMLRAQTTAVAASVLGARGMSSKTNQREAHEQLERDDVLSCALARLLLWLDVAPLPALGESTTAWEYYKRNWRPGRPRPEHWPNNYARALQCVQS
jgi:hypothetical protein